MSKNPPLNRPQKPESIKNELRAEFQELINDSMEELFQSDNDFATDDSSGGGDEGEEPPAGGLLDLYFRKDAEDKDSEYIPAVNPNNGEIRAFGRVTQPDGQGKIFVNVPAKIISEIKRIDYWTVRLSGQEPFRTEKAFFVFKGLNPNKTYRAVVRGFNKDGKEIGKSQPITFKTIPKTEVPDNPDPLSLDANFGGQDLVVRWTYNNPRSDFKVFKIRYSNVEDDQNPDPPYIETDISGNKNVFTFEENKKYFGVPSPKIRVNVKAKDTSGNESSGIFVVATNAAPANSPTLSYKDGNNKSNPNGYTLIINTENAPRDLQKVQIFEWTAASGGTATLVKTINRKKIENDDDDITEVQITKRGKWTQTWVSARYVDVFNQKGNQSTRLTVNNNWDAGGDPNTPTDASMQYINGTLVLRNSQLLVGDLNSKTYISLNYNNNNRIVGVHKNRIKFILNANTGNASFAGKVRQGAKLGNSKIRVNQYDLDDSGTSPVPTATGSYALGGSTISLSVVPPDIFDPEEPDIPISPIQEGSIVKGPGIPDLTRIESIDNNILTVNKTFTSTQNNVTLTFPKDPYQGLNVNDRIILTDNVDDGSILFLADPSSAGYASLSSSPPTGLKTSIKNLYNTTDDIAKSKVIGEVFDASKNPNSFTSSGDGTTVNGFGIGMGDRESFPIIEVGKVINSSNQEEPRIRLVAGQQPLANGVLGPVLTIGVGAGNLNFRMFGGNASKIDGFANDTTATKLLGKNADGFLRWYDPGEGGAGITVFELGSAADSNLLQLATITGGYRLGLDTQVANRIFAGPASGVDDMPAFRSLVMNDLPSGVPNSIIGANGTSVILSGRQYTVEGRTYTTGDDSLGISINNTTNQIINTGYKMVGSTIGWDQPRTSPRNRITFGPSLPTGERWDGDIHIEF